MKRSRRIVIGIGSALLALVLLVGLGAVATPPSIEPLGAEPPGEELVARRDRTSKTRHLGGNNYSLDISIGSVHYRDELGDWLEIDNGWSVAAAPWDWEMLEDGYHTRVLEDFTAGQILEFESQGETIAFQPMALEWTNNLSQIELISMPQDVAVSVTNDPVALLPGMAGNTSKVRWDNGYGTGRHFEWENTPGRLSKLLVLDSSPPAPPEYIIDGGSPVLRLSFIFDPSADLDIYVDGTLWDKSSDEQAFGTIEFRLDDEFPEHNWGDEVLWGFMPAAYWDSDEEYGVALTELRKVGNKLYVSVRVPYEWLQTATYPVYIDPTLDLQVGASLDDARQIETGAMTTTASTVYVVSSTSEGSRQWLGLRWTGVDISEGATIDVAYATLYVTGGDDVNGNIHFEEATSPAQFSTDAYDITGRDRTENSISWVDDTLNDWEDSPSVIDSLQEVIDSHSPTALVMIIRPNQDVYKALNVRAYDGSSANAAKLHVEYTAASNTILLQVAADLDDVHEQESSGDVTDAADYIRHIADSNDAARHWGAHRWTGISGISAGDTIDKCYVQLYCASTSVDDTDGFWHFQDDTATPAQFTAGAANTDVTERARTAASVQDDQDSLGAGWYTTAELKTVLQELVDNYSPTALALIFRPAQTDTKNFYIRSHNYDSALAARIFIKWTPAAAAAGYSYGTIIG